MTKNEKLEKLRDIESRYDGVDVAETSLVKWLCQQLRLEIECGEIAHKTLDRVSNNRCVDCTCDSVADDALEQIAEKRKAGGEE